MSMGVQTFYGFNTPKGVAGGLYDLSAHEVVTRQAEEATTFGVGVVIGTTKGIDVKAPTAESESGDFEGVVVHNSVMAELDMNNRLEVAAGRTVGCLHYGRIWVKTGKKAKPAYKAKVFMITDGEEAGLFTTTDDTEATNKVELNGIFLGAADDGIANAEFFNAPAPEATSP